LVRTVDDMAALDTGTGASLFGVRFGREYVTVLLCRYS
jgi:hypothetical protein